MRRETRTCMNEPVASGGGWNVMDEPCMSSASAESLGSEWPRRGSK